eukprot:3610786-Pyramimonas_sp.AAC.2
MAKEAPKRPPRGLQEAPRKLPGSPKSAPRWPLARCISLWFFGVASLPTHFPMDWGRLGGVLEAS